MIFFARIFFATAFVLAGAAQAQDVEIGGMGGRDGASLGPSILLQGNVGPVELFGFAGRSSISNYNAGEGVKASLSDRTLGFGVACRVVRVGRKIYLGLFGEAAYYGSQVRASYFDPNYGVQVQYRASNKDPLITIGPELNWRVTRRVSVFVRPGRDFGDNLAASTAKGFSINGGVKVDAGVVAKGFAGYFKKLVQ